MAIFGGYSLFDGLWKRNEREKYLKTHLNQKEKSIYQFFNNILLFGLFIILIYAIYVIKSGMISIFGVLIVMTNLTFSVIRMQYRRIKLIQYGYYKRESKIKNLFFIIVNIAFFIISFYGLISAIRFLNNTITNILNSV